MAAGSTGGGGSSHAHQHQHQHQHHIRGTPYHVRPGPLRLALVVAAVFLAFPALSTPLFRSIKGAERFPPELVLVLLVAGAGAWAAAAFTAFSAWLAIGLGLALGGALEYLGTQGLVPPTLTPLAAAPLLAAGLLSHPALSGFDPLLVVGLLAGAGSQGLLSFKESAVPAEVSVLVAGVVITLLSSPGLIGQEFSRALSPLSSYPAQGTAALVSLGLACAAPSVPSALTAVLTAALLAARALSRPGEPTEDAARQNARASHWLLAGLLASLAAVTARGMDAAGSSSKQPATAALAGVACLGLLLLGAGVSVLVTALLAATAAVWGPVRSGEFQMVTLDFLALCAYFVAPLGFVWYLAAEQLRPLLPQTLLPAALATQADRLKDALSPLLPSHPLAQLVCLALLVAAVQEALEESSIIWAHWLIRTYTLGALDTKRVALVARLESLLLALADNAPSDDDGSRLPALLKESGVAHLNVLVSPELAAERPDACRALARAGHTLGLETAAGPFAFPLLASARVSQGHTSLQRLLADTAAIEQGYSQGLSWYAGKGGHRNPWALWRASRLNLHFVAPQHRVVLGDNAGRELRARLDPWCRGGIVLVDVAAPSSAAVLKAALTDLAAQAKEGGYSLEGLAAVCPEVQRMVLSTEE